MRTQTVLEFTEISTIVSWTFLNFQYKGVFISSVLFDRLTNFHEGTKVSCA